MLETQFRMVRPRHSDTRKEGHFGRVVGIEQLPPEAILEVVTNPLAAEILHPEVRVLATKDNLVENCCMTVARGKRNVLTPSTWGRALPQRYGLIPYSNFIGGTVMTKGNSATGDYYDQVLMKNATNLREADNKPDPIGFFGEKDAMIEMQVGNLLLRNGYRAALPLGHVVLDPVVLERWFEDHATGIDLNYIKEQIYKVRRNKDYPAILFRVTGVTERICLEPYGVNSSFQLPRLQAEIARAARIMRTELTFTSSENYKSLTQNIDPNVLNTSLTKISSRQLLSPLELKTYMIFLRNHLSGNVKALEKIIQNSNKDLLRYPNLMHTLTGAKDIDLAMFTQDFEESTHNPKIDTIKEFRLGLARGFYNYILKDVVPALAPSNHVDSLQEVSYEIAMKLYTN